MTEKQKQERREVNAKRINRIIYKKKKNKYKKDDFLIKLKEYREYGK
jgi:hypothetical protein